MAKKNNIRMPQSGAGLTTFYDESASKIHISPQAVLIIVTAIAVIMIVLNAIS